MGRRIRVSFAPQRLDGFTCERVLLVTPRGVLFDVYRRKWQTQGNIAVRHV